MNVVKIWFNYGDDPLAKYIDKLIDDEGQLYQRKPEPYKIEILDKDEFKTISGENVYLKKGTAILQGGIVIPNDVFEQSYEPYKSSSGDIVPNTYYPIMQVDAIKNPFGKPVAIVGTDGYEKTYNEDCYIVRMKYLFNATIPMSKRDFEENFNLVTKEKQLKI